MIDKPISYLGIDFGAIPPASITVQVKTCKRRKHQYFGHNRCMACKREYDRRYHKVRRQEAKRRKFTFQNFSRNMPTPPIKFISTTGI